MATPNWTRPLRRWRTSRFAAVRYAWLVCHQFWGWLGFLSLVAWTISLVTDQALSFLPAWLDSFRESLPWVLLAGSAWGSYKIFDKRERRHKLERDALVAKLKPYESAAPHVEVGIYSSGSITDFQAIVVGPLLPAPNINEVVERSQRRLIRKYEVERARSKNALLYSLSDGYSSLQDEDYYLDDVDRYLGKVRVYLHDRYHYALVRERVTPVTIALRNTGSAPLRDVVLEVHLPGRIKAATDEMVMWYEDHEGQLLPEKPYPPTATQSISFIPRLSIPPSLPYQWNRFDNDKSSPRGPVLQDRHGQEVFEYRIRVVNPGEAVYDLDPFYLMLDQFNEPENVALPVKVFSSSWLKPTETRVTLGIRPAQSLDLTSSQAAS